MKDKIKYLEGMSMCIKDHDEGIWNLTTPATITIECGFEYEGFCTCGGEDCDFRDILKAEDAKMLNN